MYLKESDSSFEEVTLSDEEIKTAFFSVKGGKCPGFDEINYDIVKQNLNSLLVPLKYILTYPLKWHLSRENEDCANYTDF